MQVVVEPLATRNGAVDLQAQPWSAPWDKEMT